MRTLCLILFLATTATGQYIQIIPVRQSLPTGPIHDTKYIRYNDSTWVWTGQGWNYTTSIAVVHKDSVGAIGASPPAAVVDSSVFTTNARLADSLDGFARLGHTHAGPSSSWTELKRTAADTTFAAINAGMKVIGGLEFNVLANSVYEISATVTYGNVAATTTGLVLGFTAPTATVAALTAQIPNAADGVGGEWQGWLNGAVDSTVCTATPVTSSYFTAYVFGRIYVGANAGAFRLTWRPEAAANVTVRQYSSLDYRKLN